MSERGVTASVAVSDQIHAPATKVVTDTNVRTDATTRLNDVPQSHAAAGYSILMSVGNFLVQIAPVERPTIQQYRPKDRAD